MLYNLDAILAVGYRVRSPRGVQFRRWASTVLKEYLVKGFVMDDERLKNPDGRPDYFDEMLARIRDIRASEKRFYQKVRDLFALSSDDDKTDKATKLFFATIQNILLYAVTEKTAAELVLARANGAIHHSSLLHWKGNTVRQADQQDEAWLSAQLETAAVVTDAEMRAHFEHHHGDFALLERWRARHLFLSNHERGKGDRELEIREIAGQVVAGKLKWPDVIAKRSDDERTKLRQGDLDWFSAERLPAEFIAAVKTQALGKVGEPVKTALGWHLVEVLEKRPAREAEFDECASEIRAKLEVSKKDVTLQELLKSLLNSASARIQRTSIPIDSILPQGYRPHPPPPTS
jgi:parvulin-like peptidyl-prolyl isomerase